MKTSRFGEVMVDKSLVFDFISPIIGYNDYAHFALVDYKSDSPFKWLQSLEDEELAFAVTLCGYFDIDYEFELTDDDAKLLELKDPDDILALNIVTIPHECPQKATINLLAPIVVNTTNNKAMQVVLRDNNRFAIKHPLFQQTSSESGACVG
ncbi:flagellar assembly factor FliW [Candidatus Gastranaerophilus sp. (ex Termes propinquus)]|nr:flagellar assembly factor FliW [Candidatus Gastranaerophilus sp. (ex Termes propinquus)]